MQIPSACFTLIFIIMPLLFFGQGSSPKNVYPNVILILADDMAVGDVAKFNGGLNQTPSLDQLIDGGIWFNQGYSASAVCAPARAALLTGRYPHRTGVVALNMKTFPTLTSLGLDERTMADVFKANGYHTGLVGKWHLGSREQYHPAKRGFDEFWGFRESGYDIETYFKYQLEINGTYKSYDGECLTDVLTDYAIQYINTYKDEPFFLHLAYYAPHRPLGAPEKLVEEYRKKGFDLEQSQVYAMIEVMDEGVGKLLDELDRLGIRENTIIMFASDNGPDPLVSSRFNQHLKGAKYDVYEGGIRVPMVINWKGHLDPKTHQHPFHFIDVLPTLSGFCQLDLGESTLRKLDGNNLSFELRNKNDTSTTDFRYYWQWNRGAPIYSHNAAVREGKWKLVYPPIKRGIVVGESNLKPRLFNIQEDPTELADVSAKHQKIYLRMQVLLDDWSRKVEADRLKSANFDN